MSAGMKFGRAYHLQVQGQDLPHIIEYPLTCVFNITRTEFASLNIGRFSLYGLSEVRRKDIYFDRNTLQAFNAPITFRAGYTSQNSGAQAGDFTSLPLVFSGSVKMAYTERNGPELITHIEAFDGGYGAVHSPVIIPYNPGTTYIAGMQSVMKTMLPSVKPGQIVITKNMPPPMTDAGAFNGGSAMDVLQKYLPDGATAFIDMNTVHILGQNDTLTAPAAVSELSSRTGLLGVPKRQFYKVESSMIFEPSIVIGQSINLISTLAPWVNGIYKVTGFSHHGTISGAECANAITDLTLLSVSAL